MKKCCTCNEPKPLDDFPLKKGAKDGHCGECRACRKIRNRKHYLIHQAERIANSKIYYEEHQAQIIAYRRVHYEANKEAILAYQVNYRAEHKSEMQEYHREHYRKYGAAKRAYRRARRDQVRSNTRANNTLRKARQRNSPVCDFTPIQWAEMQAAYGYRCAYCGIVPELLTMDHVIPLAKGGSHTGSNIVPACLICNMHKKAGPPPPFIVFPVQSQ